jgi:hypothetical protein
MILLVACINTVLVVPQSARAFALGVKQAVNFNGNYLTSDSFDSSDPASSNNGRYDPARSKDNGDILAGLGLTNMILAGGIHVHGHVATGPGGIFLFGPNDAIGSRSWQASHTGIQPGWTLQEANFSFSDATLPYVSGLSIPGPGSLTQVIFSLTTNNIWTTNYYQCGCILASNFLGNAIITSYPNPVPGGLTVLNTNWVFKGPYPAPNTYVMGTLVAHNGDTNYWDYWAITSWTYPIYSYNYNT